MRSGATWFLAATFCTGLAGTSSPARAQAPSWEQLNADGIKLFEKGRYSEAEQRFLSALKKSQQLGQANTRLASTLNNLAMVYRIEGRYSEAEPLQKRALETNQKILGPSDPAVAADLNNLAILYRATGRYDLALPLQERALAIDEKTSHPQPRAVARDLQNLAAFYEMQGRYTQAEPLCERREYPDVCSAAGRS